MIVSELKPYNFRRFNSADGTSDLHVTFQVYVCKDCRECFCAAACKNEAESRQAVNPRLKVGNRTGRSLQKNNSGHGALCPAISLSLRSGEHIEDFLNYSLRSLVREAMIHTVV